MDEEIENKTQRIVPLPVDWPGRPLPVMPGDFSHYAPDGMGLNIIPAIRPYDSLEDSLNAAGYYGLSDRSLDPVRGAPLYDPDGGVIYFDADAPWASLETALSLMGVSLHEKDFVVFAGSSSDPQRDRYADQARIIQRGTLRRTYGAGPDADALGPQSSTVGDFIQQFMAEQKKKWNQPPYAFSPAMYGMFGGDGDYAKEELCFGFMVENAYLGVYRIWSRAWLVTK
jgi:hypothetical protein